MDDKDKIKIIAKKLKLDVPIMKVIEQDRRIILYLYGGSMIELGAEEWSDDPAVISSPPPYMNHQKGLRKGKVMDGRD